MTCLIIRLISGGKRRYLIPYLVSYQRRAACDADVFRRGLGRRGWVRAARARADATAGLGGWAALPGYWALPRRLKVRDTVKGRRGPFDAIGLPNLRECCVGHR
jgi:hypothetical protein